MRPSPSVAHSASYVGPTVSARRGEGVPIPTELGAGGWIDPSFFTEFMGELFSKLGEHLSDAVEGGFYPFSGERDHLG